MRRALFAASVTMLALASSSADSASANRPDLQQELVRLGETSDGRVGACVAEDRRSPVCAKGDQRFPMQSVMKLFVGVAVMDAVDRQDWRLDTPVIVRREDLSICHQPLADLVTDKGYATTIGELLRRAIVDSDCAAADVLIARLGGVAAVQSVLARHGIDGVRIDRDERHLQTEIAGLSWLPEYSDPKVFDAALAGVPKQRRSAMYRAYQTDPRDTATPRAMIEFLQALAEGDLLSPASTRHILQVMSETTTFSDRLKAALAPGWSLAHKTGTSGGWDGVTAATNDVGLFTAPDGRKIFVAAFVADSHASPADRNALIAAIGRAALEYFRP